MNATITNHPPALRQTSAVSMDERQVVYACKEALLAESNYALKAVIAGLMLSARRKEMQSEQLHQNIPWRGVPKQTDQQFTVWLCAIAIPKPTAYRWMAAAENVARGILKIPKADPFDNAIDVEGVRIPISQALTAPEAELSDEALEFRQAFFDFLQDKTLAEATRAAVDGESPAHRISRAVAGKQHGGAPDLDLDTEARKQFPLFAARALAEALSHIGASISSRAGGRLTRNGGHWSGLSATQQQETRDYLSLFAAGLDEDLLSYLSDAARQELAARKKGKRPEPLSLKAVVAERLNERARKTAK